MKAEKMKIEPGSGNVFADLGRPNAEAHMLKAELVARIDKIIRQRGLKQVEAAKLLGLSQPDVSHLLRGSFRKYSVERLLRLLMALGRGRGNRHSRAPLLTATRKAQCRSINDPA